MRTLKDQIKIIRYNNNNLLYYTYTYYSNRYFGL